MATAPHENGENTSSTRLDVDVSMINDDDRRRSAGREGERSALFTCWAPLVEHSRMAEPEKEAAPAPEAFNGNFTTLRAAFRLRLAWFIKAAHLCTTAA